MDQIWLRHKNGNGRKYGNDAEVDATTYLDRQSRVGDNAEVYSSRIVNSLISDDVIISNANIQDSTIKDQTRILGTSDPWNDLRINGCELAGDTRIRDRAFLYNVNLTDVVVYGKASLLGSWDLHVPLRIHDGIWKKPPRFLMIESESVKCTLSECTKDRFHLGCWCLPREKWFRKGYRQRLGAHSGWTPSQIELAFDTFSTWARL